MTTFSFSRLADYLRAVAALGIAHDPGKQRAVAEILGLAAPDEASAVQPTDGGEVTPPPAPSETIPLEAQARATATVTADLRTSPRQARQRRRPVPFTIQPLPRRPLKRPEWLDDDELLEPPRSTSATSSAPKPLLPRRSSRAILTTALATQTETNQIDVHAVLQAELEGRVLLRIPRRVVPSLSRGVQVVVDRGPAAAPFAADQKLLVDQIRAVGGKEIVSLVELDLSEDLDYFTKYRPLPGVVVALVSDLGITQVPFEQTPATEEWANFIGRIRAGGNSVVVFVPYGPERWPAALRRQAALVQWDRRTTVQSVRRALQRSGR